MKRTLIVLASLLLVVLAILISLLFLKTSSVPYLWYASLQAREERGVYIITVSDVGVAKKTVHFSSCGEVLKTKGIKLLNIEDPQDFVGMEWSDIVAQYGEPHADVGSGFYIPSYITENAFLITFQLDDDDVVREVYIEDLIPGRETNIT